MPQCQRFNCCSLKVPVIFNGVGLSIDYVWCGSVAVKNASEG